MNNEFGIYDNTFNLILDTLQKEPKVEKAAIYGSRAMGNYRTGSDIDIALFGDEVDHEIVSKIHFILNEELPIPYFVDVLSMNDLKNESLRKHIIREGKVFYERTIK